MKTPSLVRNAADVEQVTRGARQVRDREAERHALLVAQLSTYQGRHFVWSLLEACGVDDLVEGSADQVQRFLGRREIGIALRRDVMTRHPQAWLTMEAEAIDRQQRDGARLAALAAGREES